MGANQSRPPCEAAAIACAENRVLRERLSRLALNEASDDSNAQPTQDQTREVPRVYPVYFASLFKVSLTMASPAAVQRAE